MASPFVGVTDQPLDTPFVGTDYNFLNFAQSRIGEQYQQGVNQVKSIYSSVLNAPLSNPANQQVRQQYMQQANDKVQALAKSDLSLPQNVGVASKIFAPFYEDTDILHDINKTKEVQNQMQAGFSARDSTDDKVRNTYNPYSIMDMSQDLQDLKTAKRGDGSIGNVQIHNYTPQLDITDDAAKWAKEEGFEGIDWSNPQGPVLIKGKNGPSTIPSYDVWLRGHMGSKYDPQFEVEGRVHYRNDLNAIQSQYPNMSKEQATQMLANNKYNELDQSQTERIDTLKSAIKNTFDTPIKDMDDKYSDHSKRMTPEDLKAYDALIYGKQKYNGQLTDLQNNYYKFSSDRDKTIDGITKSPESYYSQLVKDNTVHNWAVGRAAAQSEQYGINQAWIDTDKSNQEWAGLNLKGQIATANNMVKQNAINEKAEKDGIPTGTTDTGINTVTSSSTNTTANNQNTQSDDSIRYLGNATTTLQHTNLGDVVQNQKNYHLNSAVANTFNMNGMSGALSKLGIDDATITDFNSLGKKAFSPEFIGKSYTPTGIEQNAQDLVKNKLQEYLGRPIPNTINGIRDAMFNFINTERDRRLKNGTIDKTNDPFITAYTASQNAQQDLKDWNNINKAQKDMFNNVLLKHKDKYGQLINDTGTGLATTSDIANTFDKELFGNHGVGTPFTKDTPPTVSIVNSDTGEEKTLTTKELADLYSNKRLESNGYNLQIDGQNNRISKIGDFNIPRVYGVDESIGLFHDITGGVSNNTTFGSALNNVTKRYGDYATRDQLNTDLSNTANQSVSYFKDATGKMGKEFLYKYGTEKDPGQGIDLVQATLAPGNQGSVLKFDDGTSLTPKQTEQLQSIAGSSKMIRENLGEPHYLTVSPTGNAVVQFTVGNDKKNFGDLAGKKVTVDLAPSAQAQVLQTLPQNSGTYTYEDIMRNGMKSDKDDESMGIKYSIQPDDREHPTVLNMRVSRRVKDPNTGRDTWSDSGVVPIPLSQRNPDEIVRNLRQTIYTNLQQYLSNSKTYGDNNGVMTLNEYKKSRGIE